MMSSISISAGPNQKCMRHQSLNLPFRQPRLVPYTILCSNHIESSLELTTTYGPQMFVTRLRIPSAR
jgi:hypothetical protein